MPISFGRLDRVLSSRLSPRSIREAHDEDRGAGDATDAPSAAAPATRPPVGDPAPGMGAYSANRPEDAVVSSSSSRALPKWFPMSLRSTNRNVFDFHIRADEPHRNYEAGDFVLGAVILTVSKPIRVTHLVVALHGYVRVYKGPASVSEPINVPTGQSGVQYHGKGYASLFQDEQVLSGEGRLDAGTYQFHFKLQFPREPPLPCSIDFERGTISYVVRATLTKPTTISPTAQCDRRVTLVEKLDIGLIPQPRPRTIFLEPISKRSRKRRTHRSDRQQRVAQESPTEPRPASRAEPGDAPTPAPSEDASQDSQRRPPSSAEQGDVRSEFSAESGVSSSTGGGVEHYSPHISAAHAAKLQAVDAQTITTTIELLKGGCLPGDTIPVKITVQHIKCIKSVHGVILTLYRQGRIDSAPRASSFTSSTPKDESKRSAKDQQYPRSKTSIGGLSVHSTTSLSVFRKDLAQAVTPLIIDPVTMKTIVNINVRVPEDSFPSIRNVPGDMISFRYYLEIIVDLGGRIANQIQSGGPSTRVRSFPVNGSGLDGGPGTNPSWVTNPFDTSHLRREKGVIYDGVEVVVGTMDSERQRARAISKSLSYTAQDLAAHHDDASVATGAGSTSSSAAGRRDTRAVNGDDLPPPPGSPPPLRPPPPPSPPPPADYFPPRIPQPPVASHSETPPETEAPRYIPPPNIPDTSRMSEKDRIRLQERHLLPSQPQLETAQSGSGPSAPGGGPNLRGTDDLAPSAPYMPIDGELAPSAPDLEAIVGPSDPAPSAPVVDERGESSRSGRPSPNLSEPNRTSGLGTHIQTGTEDKQELERQRLLGQVSAPPTAPDEAEASSSVPGEASTEPSAPVLLDEEDYGAQYAYGSVAGSSQQDRGHEPLPRYER